jgi:hypothetical protein
MATDIGNPPAPLQAIIPSYAYQQYSDDADIQAFISAYNQLAQSYLAWFNATPLSVYTSPNVSGALLDWIMQGVYGISRPVFSSETSRFVAGINSAPVNAVAVDGNQFSSSGSATLADDDYYKRVGTWILYVGDGRVFNIQLLRRRVARFLYGVNGTDINFDLVQTVSISVSGTAFTITIPPVAAATYFEQGLNQGVLPFPFQYTATVVIT